MATTDRAAELHYNAARQLLNEFKTMNPGMTAEHREEYFLQLGVTDASRLLEVVNSQESGVPMDSRVGRDHADGSNSKLTARYDYVNGQQTAVGWRVNIENCEGAVRVRLNHPKTQESYKAYIPSEIIRGVKHLTFTDCKRGGVMAGKWGKYLTKIG